MTGERELAPEETYLAFTAMRELRSHLESAEEFVQRVNGAQRPEGYRLVGSFADDGGGNAEPVAVTGFRRLHTLAWGDELDPDVLQQLKTPTTTAEIDMAPVHMFCYLDLSYADGAQGRLKELVQLGALNASHGWSEAYVDEGHLPPRLFVMDTDLADCRLAAKHIVHTGHAMGLPVRPAQGLLLARPYPGWHTWVEFHTGTGWLAAGVLRTTKDGDTAISAKRRTAMNTAIDEFVEKSGFSGKDAVINGNIIRSFLVHNGIFIQGRAWRG